MATDRAIHHHHHLGVASPTLRVYRWKRPTVTVGAFQAVDAIDFGECALRGIPVVRRPTGGRGVLHHDEITYSITGGVADGVPAGRRPSYAHLVGAVVEAYRLLGVNARHVTGARRAGSSAACYLHTSVSDVSVDGRKLSGSAQVWKGESVMQHGSLVRTHDHTMAAAVFGLTQDGADRLRRRTATLVSETGLALSDDQIVQAVVEGFSRVLNAHFEPGMLTPEELEYAHSMIERLKVTASR